MKIYFKTLTVPKKAAKRIKKYYSPEDSFFEPMKLSEAQEIAAVMLGYDSWHQLVKETNRGLNQPSLLDEDCDPPTQKKRIDYQNSRLGYIVPLIENVRRQQITLRLRVSSRNPKSENLIEQNYNRNHLLYWEDPDLASDIIIISPTKEWRFFPSLRSYDEFTKIYDLQDEWDANKYTLKEYFKLLKQMLGATPESIYIVCEMLRVSEEMEYFELVYPWLDQIEKLLYEVLPLDLPKTGYYHMCWGTIENRPFLRTAYWLALNFYRIGKFSKARFWFEFTSRASKHFRYECIPFIKDLRNDTPYGDVHLLDAQELQGRAEEGRV